MFAPAPTEGVTRLSDAAPHAADAAISANVQLGQMAGPDVLSWMCNALIFTVCRQY